MSELLKITTEKEITSLSKQSAIELQNVLKTLGFYIGKVDGIVGKLTLSAFANFKSKYHLSKPTIIGTGSIKLLLDLSSPKDFVSICSNKCRELGLPMREQIAYVLATVDHETNGTMKPVKEAYWLSEEWRLKNLRYSPYYGRGFVQITWKENYDKFAKILGVDLVNNPDLTLQPDYALEILVYGFKHGTFTNKKLEDYVNNTKIDFINARRCINGLDRASDIAKLAKNKYLPLIS